MRAAFVLLLATAGFLPASLWAQTPLVLEGLRSDSSYQQPPVAPVPALHRAFTDPVFGTTIMRVTDPSQSPPRTRIRHYYSKANPFNADESRAVLFASDGSKILYDTVTWTPIKDLRIVSGDPEIHWDPKNSDLIYHLDFVGNSPNVRGIYRYDVRTDTRTLVRDFPEYETVRGKLEGNFDRELRYYAMVGKKGQSLEALVYDLKGDKVLARLPVTERQVADWISVSPGGRYVVMMGKERSSVYDLQLKHLHDLPKGSFGHADLCLRADGSEVMVYDGADHQLDRNRNLNMADLATGVVSKLVRIGWRTTPHVSCRNLDLPGWALVSTQGPDRDYPNRDFEIFWVKLDGSGEVRRVAHHHSSREKGGYFAEQHATSNRTGSKIIFSSNWDGAAPVADYVVQLPRGSAPKLGR